MRKLSPKMVEVLAFLYVEGDQQNTAYLKGQHGFGVDTLKRLQAKHLIRGVLRHGRIEWEFTALGWLITAAAFSPGMYDTYTAWPEEHDVWMMQVRMYHNPAWTPADLHFEERMESPNRVQDIEQAHMEALAYDMWEDIQNGEDGAYVAGKWFVVADELNNVGRRCNTRNGLDKETRCWEIVGVVQQNTTPHRKAYLLKFVGQGSSFQGQRAMIDTDHVTNLY